MLRRHALYPLSYGDFIRNDTILVNFSAISHFFSPQHLQVFATEDTPLLDTALKSRTPDDHQIDIIPNTSHDMKSVQNPATDPGIIGPVVPECTNTLRHWLAEKLAASR